MTGKRSIASASQDDSTSASTGTAAEWPASLQAIRSARAFLKECAEQSQCTLLVPDKDADGLSGTLIIFRTLLALGHLEETIKVHFVSKGSNPHQEQERQKLTTYGAAYAIVVDQGSRPGPSLVPGAKTLLVDHHLSDEFPADTLVLSACKHEPVATSATLAYVLCKPLHPSVVASCDYLCAIGTMGDLGTSFQFAPPFPQEDMKACFKKYTKKGVNEAISLVNAPRRTATYDVESAWKALRASTSPSDIINPPRSSALQVAFSKRLYDARAEVNAEVERCAHAPPAFSGDGKVALLRISSGAQVHPVVATRWAGHLRAPALQVVMAANTGYTPGRTHFSCRVARCAHGRGGPPVDIIALLKSYAARAPGLAEAMGEDFARGHRQASGGIVATPLFERLWEVMQASEPELGMERPRKKRKEEKVQKNNLEGWVRRL